VYRHQARALRSPVRRAPTGIPVSPSLARDPSQQEEWPPLVVQPRVLHSSAILRGQVWQATAHACWSIMVVEARGRRKHVCQRQRAKVPALQGQASQAWEAMREMGGRRRGVDPRSLPQGVQGWGARSGEMQHTRGGCMQAKTTQNASRRPGKNTTCPPGAKEGSGVGPHVSPMPWRASDDPGEAALRAHLGGRRPAAVPAFGGPPRCQHGEPRQMGDARETLSM
jgi:hypothetical protein